jgi:hypothetical protein
MDNDDPTVCGRPQEYDASKEWQGKKVVIVSVPGTFKDLISNLTSSMHLLTVSRGLHSRMSSQPSPSFYPKSRQTQIQRR